MFKVLKWPDLFRFHLNEFILRSTTGATGASHDNVLFLRLGNVLGLQKVELDSCVDNEKSCPKDPPEGNVTGQWLGHRVFPELDAYDELGHDDGDEDPGLAAKLVTLRIIKQLESLSQT